MMRDKDELIDFYAGMAMQALIAKSPFLAELQDFEVYKKTAIGAFDYAVAMVAERFEWNNDNGKN